jgi:hypothetical protein
MKQSSESSILPQPDGFFHVLDESEVQCEKNSRTTLMEPISSASVWIFS